jgi:hypothetical protein
MAPYAAGIALVDVKTEANAVLFLVSEAASFILGPTRNVNGRLMMV